MKKNVQKTIAVLGAAVLATGMVGCGSSNTNTSAAGTSAESDAAADTTLDTAADEYGYTVSTGTFSSDNTTLDEEVLNALEGLKSEGELSDVVETDNYYYVLRLDEITDADATEEHRQEIISQRQSDLYNEVLQGWKDEAEWVLKDKVWDKVTFDNLFTTTVESTETTETTESSTTDNAVTENTEAVEGTESVQ